MRRVENKTKSIKLALVAGTAVAALAATSAWSDNLTVLWYGDSSYNATIHALATAGAGDPSATTWTITNDNDGSAPALPISSYNVVIVGSNNAQGILTSSMLGNRIFLTGQDADFHVTYGPGSTNFDGPRGFIRDAVNWAGAGMGTGFVFFTPSPDTLSGLGLTGLGDYGSGDNTVNIPSAYSAYPINTGLSSDGLSNWNTSSHESWTGIDTSLWTGINTNSSGGYVTLVTAATAGGGASGVPTPPVVTNTPIDTAAPFYLASNLGTSVVADFKGGTLQTDTGTVTTDFTVEADPTNTIDSHGINATFSGMLSGAGGLTIEDTVGGGEVIFTNTNTYTGGTYISGGADIELGAGGTTGTIAGDVVTDGALVFNRSDNITFGGVISGAGFVVHETAAKVTLTADETFSGPLIISGGGTVQFGTNAGSGSMVGDIHNGGSVIVDTGANWVYGGVISGFGSVTVAGTTGVFSVTNANTYTGGTTINSGAFMSLGNGATTGSIVGNVVDNGGLGFARTNAYTFAGVISGTGVVDQGGSGTTTLTGANTYTGGTNVFAGGLQIGNGTTVGSIVGNVAVSGGATLTYDHSDTVTPTGVISGAGTLTQAGSGLLVLNGVNTITGLTTISSGTLEVGDASHTGAVLNSSIGGVTVGALGTLKGHGSIIGAVRNLSGGTVAPGGSIGTLTVGSYSQSAGSTLAIEVAPTAASQLNSLGAASLNGTLALTFDPGTYTSKIYKIVAGAPVSGTFSTVTQSGLPTTMIYGVYYKPDTTQVDLVVEAKSAGQGFGAVSTASLDEAQSFAGMVSDRQDDAGCASDNKAQKAAGKSASCDGVSVWGQVLGQRVHTNGAGEIGSADDTDAGFIGGLDGRFAGDGSLGVAVAYADTTMSMDSVATKSTGHALFASVYGRVAAGGFVFDGQGFYMDSRWTQRRIIAGYGAATSHPNGTTGGGVVQVSYPMMDGTVKPYLKVSYADFNRDATTETGAAVGPLTLEASSGSNSSTRAEAGVKFSTTSVDSNGIAISPELRIGVSQDLSSNTRDAQVRLALAPTTTFTSSAVKPDQTAGVVAGAMRVNLSDKLDFYADMRGRFSQNQSEGSLTIGGRYRF